MLYEQMPHNEVLGQKKKKKKKGKGGVGEAMLVLCVCPVLEATPHSITFPQTVTRAKT